MTQLGNTLSGHFMTFLHGHFDGKSDQTAISKRELRQAMAAYIAAYENDPNISVADHDKINHIRNLKAGQLHKALKKFDEDDRTLSRTDLFMGQLYSQYTDDQLAQINLHVPAFADVAQVVDHPAPAEHTEGPHRIGQLNVPSDDILTALHTIRPIDQSDTAETPGQYHIVPGANPNKVTIYFYENQHERILDAMYQYGDEIDSTQIFIKSDYTAETVDAALADYMKQQFGDDHHMLENITFESHGRGLELISSNTDDAQSVGLYQMMYTLSKYSPTQDYSGCEVIPDWHNTDHWRPVDDVDVLLDLANFVDRHDLDITLNTTESYITWDPNDPNTGAGGEAYIFDANGQILALLRGSDADKDYRYADDVLPQIGREIHQVWQGMGGLYATTDEAEDATKQVVSYSLSDMSQM